MHARNNISLQMTNNIIKNSTEENFELITENGGEFYIHDNEFSRSLNSSGLYIDHFSGSGVLSNNVFSNNNQSGIEFWEGNNITIIDSTFSGNEYGMTAYNSTVIILNSSISSSSNDFDLYGKSHFISLNTSFDNSSTIFGDSVSDLTVKWYLNVHVVDNIGSGVDDAFVYVNDSLGSNEWSQNTGSGNNGWIYFIPTTEYIENYSGKYYRTPHNVSAHKGDESGFEFPKIWHSSDVTVVLNSKPTVENLWPQGGGLESVFRGDTIFNTGTLEISHGTIHSFSDQQHILDLHQQVIGQFHFPRVWVIRIWGGMISGSAFWIQRVP
jgi:parallel beta-helix repeat protein